MVNIDENSKKLLTENLVKLKTYQQNPGDKEVWNVARMAIGVLGDTAGRLLAQNAPEDIAISSSLSELDGCAENLHFSPRNKDFRQSFDLSLGDVEYRMRRLFGVTLS